DARNTTLNQNPASAPASRNLQYVHRDHLGSTRLMTDENGIEIGRWKYFPFGMGATVEESGDQRMKFTGHERDGEVELDYMLARYYGANLGRFLSVDPVQGTPEDPQSWNLYPYVTNNPLRFNDPTGEDGNDVANWIDDKVGTITSSVQASVGSGVVGVLVDAAVSTAGDLVSGTADLLRVGASTGEAIGSGANGEGVVRAVAEDVGRASGLALAMAAPANAALRGSGAAAAETPAANAGVAGGRITGHTKHGLNQAISRDGGRGVSPRAMLDAAKNPVETVGQSGGRTKYVGKDATVVTNKDGKVITTHANNRNGVRDPLRK
ncbi:MAG: RHS repeat-associated core domain-containing protein, partial [Acidobacteriota bacterium]|nr:RHS repeat-associated core domain-containing protein [Acidobacteriota bacterium]